MEADFMKFPKIGRLNRNIVISEKIDGTNAQIFIQNKEVMKKDKLDDPKPFDAPFMIVAKDGIEYIMLAGSRKRYISAEKKHPTHPDNYGFGRWVSENADELIGLGERTR